MVDPGKPVDGIFLDFSKDFDTVPPRMLLDKVPITQLDEHIVECVSNWLTGQALRLAVNGVTPRWQLSPEGSAGLHWQPWLSNVFINDVNTGLDGIISKFTDDAKLGGTVTCLKGREALQRDLPNRDGQSPTVGSLTREGSDSAPGMGSPGLVYGQGKEGLQGSCREGPGGPGQG